MPTIFSYAIPTFTLCVCVRARVCACACERIGAEITCPNLPLVDFTGDPIEPLVYDVLQVTGGLHLV